MADGGFGLLWRKFFDHELWQEKRALSRAEAWIDLVFSQAAFADYKKRIGGEVVLVARGQLIASQRFLAIRWRWSVGKVRRFLAYLKAQDMMRDESRMNAGRIETDTGIGTLYTIVNYPLMQDLQNAVVPATDQQRTGNGPKIKKIKKDSTNVESGWSKPAGTTWKKHMGGSIPPVRLNVALSPLVAEHGAEEVLKWWDKYLTSSTAAQFKTPENFAQRYGAWKREHLNGSPESAVSVDDIRRCVTIGGSALGIKESRETGYHYIEEKDPDLWARAGATFQKLDVFGLYKLRDQSFHLGNAISAQLANLRARNA